MWSELRAVCNPRGQVGVGLSVPGLSIRVVHGLQSNGPAGAVHMSIGLGLAETLMCHAQLKLLLYSPNTPIVSKRYVFSPAEAFSKLYIGEII